MKRIPITSCCGRSATASCFRGRVTAGFIFTRSMRRVGRPTALSPGDFEVQSVALAQDRKTVYFTSNQFTSDRGDIDRRHLWQVSVGGGGARQLTHGDGIEVAPVVAADGTIALLHSDARVPIRPAVVAANGEMRDVAPQLVPGEFPAAKLVVPRQVILSVRRTDFRFTGSCSCLREVGRNTLRSSSSMADRADRCCSAGTICSTTQTRTR